MRRRAILLVPGSTYRARDFVEAAERLDVDIIVGVHDRQAARSAAHPSAAPSWTLGLDFDDIEGSTRRIAELADESPVHAVVGADDETTALAAAAAGALGLPHNPLGAVLVTRSKRALRRILTDAGLPSPGHRVLDLGPGFAEAGTERRASAQQEAAAATLDAGIVFPCVLKPTFLSASRGVIRADDADEFRAAVDRIGAVLHAEAAAGGGAGESGLILVEDYVPGDEYAVDAMLTGGTFHLLALFDKPDPLEGPFFEETIYVTPSRAPESTQKLLISTLERGIAAVGLEEGPVHAELRVNEDGAFIIELAARTIGGLCPRILRFGAGASLEELILRHALGEDFGSSSREDSAAGVMMIPIPAAGVLRAVHGVQGARAVEGVCEVTMTINVGQQIVPLPEGNRYLGFILARADTPGDAESALRRAHGRLRFEIEAGAGSSL